MKVKDLKRFLNDFNDEEEMTIAIPPNVDEGIYKIAMILPNMGTFLLGGKVNNNVSSDKKQC